MRTHKLYTEGIKAMDKITREERIRLRSKMYANGEIGLDDFYSLEKESLEEEELESNKSENMTLSLSELDEMRRSTRDEDGVQTEDEGSQTVSLVMDETDLRLQADRNTDPRSLDRILRTITRDELQSLPMYEQQKLYDHDPRKYEEIIKGEASFFDLLHPTDRKSFPRDLTVEEFQKMSLKDLNDLYNADPDLYSRMVEESKQGGLNE